MKQNKTRPSTASIHQMARSCQKRPGVAPLGCRLWRHVSAASNSLPRHARLAEWKGHDDQPQKRSGQYQRSSRAPTKATWRPWEGHEPTQSTYVVYFRSARAWYVFGTAVTLGRLAAGPRLRG